MERKPEFKVGYGGETAYTWRGKEWTVCHHSMNSGFWAKGYHAEKIAKTGTITSRGNYHEFPPDELCAWFPGYIPARWSADFKTLEYKGGVPPVVVPDELSQPDGVVAQVYVDECDAWDAFHTELHALIELFPSYYQYSNFRDGVNRDRHVPSDEDYARVRAKKAELLAESLQTV